MKDQISFFFFKVLVWFFSLIPFALMYKISDLLAWLLRAVFKYRVETANENLRRSFPKKSKKELKHILKASYKNLSDVLLEGIKGFSMSPSTANTRYRWINPEIADRFFYEQKNAVLFASHYANWEWGTQTIGHQLKHRTLGIVKLVKNPLLNSYLQKNRCAKNVFVTDISETRSSIERFKDAPTLFVFIADQGPRNIKKAQWVDFLNQKTPCLYGADRIAREYDWPALVVETSRIKRGYYELNLKVLEEHSSTTIDGAITAKYMKSLEHQIIEKPEDWLWTHRRWKRANEKISTQ